MSFVIADRVRETTLTTGTGTVTLAGAYTGFQTFSAGIGSGNSTYYAIANVAAGQWEVGIGTYTSGANTLSRTTVLASSNAGSLVNFTNTPNDVFVTQPAERALYVSSGGTGLTSGVAAFTANGVAYASSTTGLATGSALTFDGTNLGIGGSPVSSKGQLQVGTIGYTDTGVLAGFASSVAGYNQIILQNTNSGSTASTNFNVSNDQGSATTNYGEFGINSSGFSGSGFSTAGWTYLASASTDLAIGTYGSNAIHFIVNSGTTDAMTITSSGNVGIGTSSISPIGSGYTTIALQGGNGGNLQLGTSALKGQLWFNSDLYIDSSTGAQIFRTGSTEHMRLDSSGYLGIGTSSPSSYAKLSVQTDGHTIALVNATTSNTTDISWFESNGTQAASIYHYASGYSGGSLFGVGALGTAFVQWTNAPLGIGTYGVAQPLIFGTNSSERMRLDSSGNLGLGVTPSAWSGSYKVNQILNAGFIGSGNRAYVSANWYDNGTADKYIASDYATRYIQLNGTHRWDNAASGTAGNTITFTQAMTLDASGRLVVGTTAVSGSNQVEIQAVGTNTGLWVQTGQTSSSYYIADFRTGTNASVLSLRADNTALVGGNLIQTVNTTAATLSTNGTMTISIVNNTTLKFSVRGSDGTTRSATLTLA